MSVAVVPGLPTTVAPPAPGAMGSAPAPAELQRYLDGLQGWLRGRRAELDELDAAALAAGRGHETAADMALALSMWKQVDDRYREMWATWDGGRVLQPQREKIAALIWGRIEGGGASVPEACRLSDALVAQLRTRLALTPGADASAARIKDLRAQLERIRDQVGLEPATGRDAAVDRLASLMARLAAVTEKAARGADVGGLLPALEADAAVFERDLIVGNQRRRDAREQLQRARVLRDRLEAHEDQLRELERRCVATVDPAPVYAVPDVEALGPVPNTPESLEHYLERLERVEQALTFVEEKYGAALAEHGDLVALLDGYVAKAQAHGLADRDDLRASEQQARAVLARRPAPMAVCRQLVATYQTWLNQLATPDPRGSARKDL